ncbi:MAG: PEP/pyruvate-binding domain-containing protein [Calditrichia bacterium]
MLQTKFYYQPKFSGFHDLMSHRVREILLVSSPYDAFVLEEDGRLAERIFSEYIDLNLHFIPRISKATSAEKALRLLKEQSIDLVITMTRIADMDPIRFGEQVKEEYPGKPVVMLSYEALDPFTMQKIRESRAIDKVFYWFGESKIFLTIIKVIEDLMNLEQDTRAGVQIILVIEDSPKYYSMYLPTIYTEIMTQTRNLIDDGINDLHRMLRMRARPKIILTESLESAENFFERYRHNILGIISDVRFADSGRQNALAGLKLAEKVRKNVPDLPVLLLSAEPENRPRAEAIHTAFLDKNSPNLLFELKEFIETNFGFGDFIFRFPDGREIRRAKNLPEILEAIKAIPDESLMFHAGKNHFSIWLRARTEFELADELRPKKVTDFRDAEEVRQFIIRKLDERLKELQLGVIKDFSHTQFTTDNSFIRIGSGSLGGKGRGLAFLNALLANADVFKKYSNVRIQIPTTFVLGSEVFEQFIESNQLQKFAIEEDNEELIAQRFLAADFSPEIEKDLKELLERIDYPLAVRSSSLLEDSHRSPFAGLYRTYMMPNNHPNPEVRVTQLLDAIKLVYASVYYRAPKSYVRNTDYRIEEEKMAVVIQRIAGIDYGSHLYPTISGVAQSYNYYPMPPMEPEEGIVHLALGFGKTIVEGEKIYRFSPAFPHIPPPFGSAENFLKESQNCFYALDLSRPDMKVHIEEDFSLKKFPIAQSERDGSLFFVGSTYLQDEQIIRDDLHYAGPRVLTFANLLKHGVFPLADILKDLLELGYEAFGSHVEIEFAINLSREKNFVPQLFVLQIRPMVTDGLEIPDISAEESQNALCRSQHAIGNGMYSDIKDIVFVDPEKFEFSKTREIASELEQLNLEMRAENRPYVLIGFGRWGTSDPWLGIPVEWHQVSQAKVFVEADLQEHAIEPSQGSHFFHNLVSLRLGYLHVLKQSELEFLDWDWLKSHNAFRQTKFLKHLRFSSPLNIKINGRQSIGLISKPAEK